MVYILAGGVGSRLKPATDTPKVIASVNNRPFIHYLFDSLETAGVEDVVLCTGYAADEVESVACSWRGNMHMMFSRETVPLGTGGAIKKALSEIPTRTMLVMNGDSFTDVDFLEFLCWHRKCSNLCSVLLARVDDASRYGSIVLGENDQILRFSEKSAQGPGLVNAGVYLIESAFFTSHAPRHAAFSLELEFLNSLKSSLFRGYIKSSCFIDIGLPATYANCAAFFQHALRGKRS